MGVIQVRRLILITAAVCLVAFAGSPADARNCSKAEAKMADDRLAAIEQSPADRAAIQKRHLPFGIHMTTHAADSTARNERLLLQDGYVMVHDGDLRTAIWTTHRLDGADVTAGDDDKRVNCFRTDPRLPADEAANSADYDEPIYDLGHMTNDRDLRDDLIEQLNTYVISNMSAQHCRFNRGIWLSLEDLGREWAKIYGTVYVTQGAIFDFNARDARDRDKSAGRIGPRNGKARVAIPSHYFKNFLRPDGDRWLSISFMLENHNGPRGNTFEKVLPELKDAIVAMALIKERGEITLHQDLRADRVTEATSFEGWDISNQKGGLGSNFEGSCPR